MKLRQMILFLMLSIVLLVGCQKEKDLIVEHRNLTDFHINHLLSDYQSWQISDFDLSFDANGDLTYFNATIGDPNANRTETLYYHEMFNSLTFGEFSEDKQTVGRLTVDHASILVDRAKLFIEEKLKNKAVTLQVGAHAHQINSKKNENTYLLNWKNELISEFTGEILDGHPIIVSSGYDYYILYVE